LGAASSPAAPALVALRRAAPADANLMLAWRAEPSTRRYQPLRPLTAADLRARLAEQAGRVVDARLVGDVKWIVVAATGEPVGWISLRDVNREHQLGAVGYTIGERFRGRGFATAAVRALLPFAFDAADLARVEAIAAVANTASRRVLERAGFRCEGIARALLAIDGVRVDHARYALLRSDWRDASTGKHP